MVNELNTQKGFSACGTLPSILFFRFSNSNGNVNKVKRVNMF